MILGVDQSFSCTGLCLFDGNEHIFSTIQTVPDKEDKLEKFKRAKYIAKEISELCMIHGVTDVRIEGLAMGKAIGNSTRDLAGLQYVIVNELMENHPEISITIITPTSLKKFATGKGNAKKDGMFESLPENIQDVLIGYPKTKGRFDLADAYWLAMFKEE